MWLIACATVRETDFSLAMDFQTEQQIIFNMPFLFMDTLYLVYRLI